MALLPLYNELSDFDLEMSCEDKDGNPLTPDTGYYCIWCDTNDQEVKAWTEFSISGADITIEIDGANQAIITDANTYETKTITILAQYGSGKEYYDIYQYRVKNLSQAPKV